MSAIKGETLMAVLAGMVILYMIYTYSKTKTISGFEPNSAMSSGGEPVGIFASTQGAVNSSAPLTPDSLLPKDQNAGWQSNPGGGSLTGINLLKTSDIIGLSGKGQVLKNANLQLRSDPNIPQMSGNVGPWNLSTILPDTMRAPFEIGSDCKM